MESQLLLKEALCDTSEEILLISPFLLPKDFIASFQKKLSNIAEKEIKIKNVIDPKRVGAVLHIGEKRIIDLDLKNLWQKEFDKKLNLLKEEVEKKSLDDISEHIKKIIEDTELSIKISEEGELGKVLQVGDGIARVEGLKHVGANEVVRFESGIYGIAFSLEKDAVGCMLLGSESEVEEGSYVERTGHILQVPVGDALIGRIVNAVGQPIDGKGRIITNKYRPVERKAPGVVYRQPVKEPLHTGIKAIDSLVPIGRGQRELIIGDRKIGKTTIAVDTILNQKDSGVICIYAVIGQKASSIARIVHILSERDAMKYTIIVASLSNEQTSFRYLTPYTACTIGEEFMEQGRHALVIYDDLTKHAVAYRELSALLKRPIGREAYPGDIFYVHSRLLERAAKLRDDLGGGSLTALPIVETLGGDITAYISTNIISITDGQIYLDSELFNTGFRPAINVGLSVSRVGGSAQTPMLKRVAGRFRIDLAQYHEMAAFVKFGAELDEATRAQLARGERGRELLKQSQYSPVPIEEQTAILFAVINGYLDDIPVEKVLDFEKRFISFLKEAYPDVLKELADKKLITFELEKKLKEAITKMKENCKYN